MASRIDKQPIRVALLTPWSRIEGTHHVVPGVRVSDSVNSDVAVRARYLPLTEAVVTHLETGAVLFRSSFLMVSHAHIICMAPTSEVEAEGGSATAARVSADRARSLAADMTSLLRA